MGLYSFSKKSWHVKFYAWLFNEDATDRFKTMCPYFWTWVCIMLFLSIILLVKLCGKWGNVLLVYCNDYKRNKRARVLQHVKDIVLDVNLTEEKAYKFRKTSCYKDNKYDIYNERYQSVLRSDGREISFESLDSEWVKHLDKLASDKEEILSLKRHKRNENYAAKVESINEFKGDVVSKYEKLMENRVLNFISLSILYISMASVVGLLLYGVWGIGTMINWEFVGWFMVGLIGTAGLVGLIYLLIVYCLKPFVSWLSCVKVPKCQFCTNFWNGVGRFFKAIGNGIVTMAKWVWLPIKYIGIGIGKLVMIIGHMIYSTYKKQCPIIEWNDED